MIWILLLLLQASKSPNHIDLSALKEEIKRTLLEEFNAILRQELAAFHAELQSSLSLPESTNNTLTKNCYQSLSHPTFDKSSMAYSRKNLIQYMLKSKTLSINKNLTLCMLKSKTIRTRLPQFASSLLSHFMKWEHPWICFINRSSLVMNKLLFLNSLPEGRDMAVPSKCLQLLHLSLLQQS